MNGNKPIFVHRKRGINIFMDMVIASLVFTACASPAVEGTLEPTSFDQVKTLVAATMQALSTSPAATLSPEPPPSLLPHTLYYQGNGRQVFSMERDGVTITQLTDEQDGVLGYDISSLDGTLAFIADNRLLLVNEDGSNRRVLVDGGQTRHENNPHFFKDPLSDPVFSPDGRTIAYARGGLNLYDLSTGSSRLVLPDQRSEMGFPIEIYSPVRYSPDGKKLLLALGHWESAPTHAVFHPEINTLVKYSDVEDYIYCCSFHGGPVWAPDSTSFYGIASVHDSSYQSGELWRIDAGNGAVTRMLKGGSGILNLPKEPFPGSDGQLYYFFGTYQDNLGYWDARILTLVRSGLDGVTDRTVLREDNFAMMNEALWAPDASFVIVATAPGRFHQDGGVLELYYTDAQKDMIWLAHSGYNLKWGP